MKLAPGDVIGRLTLVEDLGQGGDGSLLWRCQCACGGIVVELGSDLLSGSVTSCGECPPPKRPASAARAPQAPKTVKAVARQAPPPPTAAHPWNKATAAEVENVRARRAQSAPAIDEPAPAAPVAEIVPKTRPARVWRDDDERVPNIHDDPVGFYAWRLVIIRKLSRKVAREIHGDEREDLPDVQLGGAA